MVGFITERELERAEQAFPGIVQFLESLSQKPRTFLELLARFEIADSARHWRGPPRMGRTFCGGWTCRIGKTIVETNSRRRASG
jgi:hypothetical protein